MPKVYREGSKLTKTMVYLEEEVITSLKYLALDTNVSMAELIRRAIDDFLKKIPKRRGSKR
jgi:hypothetical protein